MKINWKTTSQYWMTCSSDAATTEGVSHTQYCVVYAQMTQVPSKKCTHWMQPHRCKFIPALLLSRQWELLIARIYSALISVQIHLWTCTKAQVLARKTNETKLARGIFCWWKWTDDNLFLLIIPADNSSGLCGTCCQPGSSHGYDVTGGSWGIWTKGTEHSETSFAKEVVICWLVLLNSYIQLAAKTWFFLLSESHHLFSVISFMIKYCKTQPWTNRSTHWLHRIKYSKWRFHLQITILCTYRDISERKYQPNLTSDKTF